MLRSAARAVPRLRACSTTSAPAPSRASVPAPDPAPSSGPRLHSTDIAFKPNADGWGYSPRFANGYDRIFGNKDGANPVAAAAPAAPATAPATDPTYSARLALLRAARDGGALSVRLFEQAKAELQPMPPRS